MAKIQLVVFDMAGTTVRDKNEVLQCFLNAAEKTGLMTNAEQINPMMGWSKRQVFQKLWQEQIGKDHTDFQDKVETSFAAFKIELENHYRTQPVEPTEGCLETFEWLKQQGIAIALNTGFYREVTNIILRRLGWDQGLNLDATAPLENRFIGSSASIIQASITPSEIDQNEGRPAPYMIQKAMYRLGVKDPQTVVAIGDTPADLEAGINAHCGQVLGVTNGTHSHEQLAAYPHHGLLNSLHELKDWIGREIYSASP